MSQCVEPDAARTAEVNAPPVGLVSAFAQSTVPRRVMSLATSVMWDLALPFGVTVAIVTILADPARIDVAELRANSLLMHARPIFRTVAPADELRVAVGDSAILLATAMLGAVAVSVPAGIAYASARSGPLRAPIWAFMTFAASMPVFFWAIVLALGSSLISVQFGLPFLPVAGFGVDAHLVLPALALGVRPMAYIFRLTAIAIEDIRHAEYVRTGVAKGLRDRQVLVRHVLPNATPSIIAAVVLATRAALSSLVIVEFVYIWGGAGTLFVQALGQRRLELASELALSFAIGSAILAFLADAALSRRSVGA